jgi:hypothetical protein
MLFLLYSCSKKDNNNNSSSNDIWDLDKNPPPEFINVNYIDLTNIYRISKFRSSVGHDYSDFTEHCRSMKHYFEPFSAADWSAIKIFSPISGTLTRVVNEGLGVKIEIESSQYPAFRISIFHINPISAFNIGDKVSAGQQLGTHFGSQTYSDISVIANDPTKQGRMVSYFNVITDGVFYEYIKRGILSRDMFIISKELRDANPLSCNGDQFSSSDPLEQWVVLK